MSGDVQPRKRKDKSKKRKDEDEPVSIREKRSSSEHSPDIQMHIEKESETGGHWCAKIVFFFLLSILIGLVALIIIENRGLTEIAQPQGESRFSEYFEGWIEEPKDHEEDEHHVTESLHDVDDNDHDNEQDETTVYEEENLSQQDNDLEESQDPVSQENEIDDQEDNTPENDQNSQEEASENDNDNDNDIDETNNSQEYDTPEQFEDENDENVSKAQELQLDDGDLPFDEDTTADSAEQFFDNDAGEELYVKRMSEEKLAKSKEAEAKSAEQDEPRGLSSETFDNNFDLFEDDLNEANDQLDNNPKKALKLFEKLLKYRPKHQSALIGKANALEKLAKIYKDNSLLREAIHIYERLLLDKSMVIQDAKLFENVAVVCVDRMTFLGNFNRAIEVQKVLVERIPDNVNHRNQLAIIYLMINRLSEAKHILHETLLKFRHNGVALVHYGFVLKQLENDLEHAVIFLKEGIESGENGTQEGLFFMNLGDALTRLGRTMEAQEIYEEGARRGLFLSAQQRSLYNVNRLKSKPFWTVEETTYSRELNLLQKHWSNILKEGEYALDLSLNGYVNESENLRERGDWKQYEIFARGRRNVTNCRNTPFTCDLIEKFTAASGCTRGQVKYSIMLPQTHVWAHTGPTNCRLRAHLGLRVPLGTYLRVSNETRSWKEKEWLIFDDSYEHEVWHNGTARRLVLIVDVWHPELTEDERRSLSAI
ncbi:aspartyl/asparaginyl beta-hydroxylase [Culicoides brevitarsis]|uniref:aspartyl/asparaginyl beta-hydroxylase n=1 Tax=Culicoides brevitarsis TaxID=469753 RepID=UPI00307C2F23